MALTFKIYVYENLDAPKGRKANGAVFMSNGEVHPVRFFGDSKEEVETKANEWLAEQMARAQRIDGRSKEGRALRKAQKEATA